MTPLTARRALVSPLLGQDDGCADGRHACCLPTTCQPPSTWAPDPWPATIRAISTSGLRLTLARRFERGSGLAIELPGEGATSTVLARVVHVDPHPEGGWQLGCVFISELSDEEVRTVLDLDHLQHATASVETPPVAHADSGPAEDVAVSGVLFQARLKAGEVVRWYIKRLDLSGSWPLPIDTVVSLRVGSPDTPPLELVVKKCEQLGDCWLVNGKFQSPPSPEVLRALGYPG